MKKPYLTYLNISCFLLIFLWIYVGLSKLGSFGHFRLEIHMQVLPDFTKLPLTYLLPWAELAAAALLAVRRTRTTGFKVSFVLLLAFTVYVGLATFHVFPKRPCSCGGILKGMNWNIHFLFNLLFTCMTLISIHIIKRKEITWQR